MQNGINDHDDGENDNGNHDDYDDGHYVHTAYLLLATPCLPWPEVANRHRALPTMYIMHATYIIHIDFAIKKHLLQSLLLKFGIESSQNISKTSGEEERGTLLLLSSSKHPDWPPSICHSTDFPQNISSRRQKYFLDIRYYFCKIEFC